jgi:hypothetical protein
MADSLSVIEIESRAVKTALRIKADAASQMRCASLICVLEHPTSLENVGSVLRNVDALGVGKLYVVSDRFKQSDFGSPGRTGDPANTALQRSSVSAVKWAYTRVFTTTEGCCQYLKKHDIDSLVTSPHQKGEVNVSSRAATLRALRSWPCGSGTKRMEFQKKLFEMESDASRLRQEALSSRSTSQSPAESCCIRSPINDDPFDRSQHILHKSSAYTVLLVITMRLLTVNASSLRSVYDFIMILRDLDHLGDRSRLSRKAVRLTLSMEA